MEPKQLAVSKRECLAQPPKEDTASETDYWAAFKQSADRFGLGAFGSYWLLGQIETEHSLVGRY